MDLVSSSEDIAASMTVSGELFESLNNLKAPKTIDNQPVNEVMEEILFRPYAPAVAAAYDNLNAYNGEIVAIRPQWIVTKKSNALAALKIVGMGNLNDVDLTQNGTTNISRDAGVVVNATVSDTQNGTLPAKRVVLSTTEGANLEFAANTTITATATDEQGLVSTAATNTIKFHYPIVVGAINDMSIKSLTIKKDGLNYIIEDVIINRGAGDEETNVFNFNVYGRSGNTGVFSFTIDKVSGTNGFYPCILVHKSLKITSCAEVSGATEQPINPAKEENSVDSVFKIGNVEKWSQKYDKYLPANTAIYGNRIVYKIQVTTK